MGPEKTRTLHKMRLPTHPSRTQQKLELQRREIMRAGAATPTTPPAHGMGLAMGSSTSLHSRTSSRNRNRSLAGGRGLAGDLKAVKQDYESAVKQLNVVRRFRSPIMESMNRLKQANVLPNEVGPLSSTPPASKNRPPSRRGPSTPTANGTAKAGISRSFEENRSSLASRQSSHDDIEVTPSRGSPDDGPDDEQGLSPEDALIRRIWDSREVYESGDSIPSR